MQSDEKAITPKGLQVVTSYLASDRRHHRRRSSARGTRRSPCRRGCTRSAPRSALMTRYGATPTPRAGPGARTGRGSRSPIPARGRAMPMFLMIPAKDEVPLHTRLTEFADAVDSPSMRRTMSSKTPEDELARRADWYRKRWYSIDPNADGEASGTCRRRRSCYTPRWSCRSASGTGNPRRGLVRGGPSHRHLLLRGRRAQLPHRLRRPGVTRSA